MSRNKFIIEFNKQRIFHMTREQYHCGNSPPNYQLYSDDVMSCANSEYKEYNGFYFLYNKEYLRKMALIISNHLIRDSSVEYCNNSVFQYIYEKYLAIRRNETIDNLEKCIIERIIMPKYFIELTKNLGLDKIKDNMTAIDIPLLLNVKQKPTPNHKGEYTIEIGNRKQRIIRRPSSLSLSLFSLKRVPSYESVFI